MKHTTLFALASVSAALLTSCGGGSGSSPAADTTAPSVSLSGVQSGRTVQLSASASDTVGVKQVEFYRGGTLLGTDSSAPYGWSDTVGPSENGTLSYSARASDAAGNIGTGSAQVGVNVASLYQGVWGWAIADASQKVIDAGAVVLFDEGLYEGRTVALGGFSNQAQTRLGFTALGPVTAAKLQVAFVQTDSAGNNAAPYLAGEDDDGVFSASQGRATFEGTGAVFVNGTASQGVYIVLLQTSTVVPQGTGLAAARVQARSEAAALAVQHRAALGTLKSAAPTVNWSALKAPSGAVLQTR